VRMVMALVVAGLVLTACGGGESTTTAGVADQDQAAPDTQDTAADAEEMAEDMAENLEETQEAVGGGSATLVVGDQTWAFDSVLCAFGEEQIGQEGAEFNMSAIQDGLQLYASIDSFGHSVSLNDIENFAEPSVALEAFPGDAEIALDGKSVSATASFVDSTSDSFEGVEGTLEATCP
jgi:hypothetical protein